MARKATVAQLEAQIQEATALLDDASSDDKPTLEAQIAVKSAELDSLKGTQERAYATEHEELIALRQQKQDQQVREAASQVASQIHHSLKTAQEQERDRMSGLIQAELAKALGGDGGVTGFDMKSLVQASLADLRFGRKTPITLTEDQGGEGEQDRRAGSVSAPNFNRKGAGLLDFMRAVAAKDYGAIREIHRKHGMKALSEGGGATSSASLGAGGALVPPEFSTEIIDLLRPEALLRNAKPDIVTMTSPQYFRPRLATAGTASYIGETTAIAPSQETFDQITLNAKKLAAIVPVSNELLRDSNPSVEKTVRDDLVKVIALKEDAQFLFGTGSATAPTGLFNRSGVQKFTPATNGDTVTYETPLNMYFKLPTANVPIRRAAWFTNPALIRTLLDVKDSQGRPIFMNYWDIQQGSIKQTDVNLAGTLMGRPLYTSTQIPLTTTGSGNTTTLALIEMSEILIGNMADLMLDTSNEASYYDGTNTISLWQSDMTGFRAVMRHDCTAYHDQAIVIYPGLLY